MEKFTAFTITLSSIERSLHKIKSAKMSAYGLRATHLTCMIQIEISPDGLSPTEIAHACAIDKAFVSRITSDLSAHNFIKINEKFNDGRKYRQKYILTEEGRVVLDEMKEAIDAIIDSASSEISDYEMRCFNKVLYMINENLSLTKNDLTDFID